MGNKVDMTNEDRKQAYIQAHVEAENARIKAKETDATNDLNPLTGQRYLPEGRLSRFAKLPAKRIQKEEAFTFSKYRSLEEQMFALDIENTKEFTEYIVVPEFFEYQFALASMIKRGGRSNGEGNFSYKDTVNLIRRMHDAGISLESINSSSALDAALKGIESDRISRSIKDILRYDKFSEGSHDTHRKLYESSEIYSIGEFENKYKFTKLNVIKYKSF